MNWHAHARIVHWMSPLDLLPAGSLTDQRLRQAQLRQQFLCPTQDRLGFPVNLFKRVIKIPQSPDIRVLPSNSRLVLFVELVRRELDAFYPDLESIASGRRELFSFSLPCSGPRIQRLGPSMSR
ncbi:hypothetical protein SAMN04490239_0632 [Rhodococcus koreensis]|uniref:Uncharacterized protein n=1 Tax=Rhodococcus koreensis TaxID=99653 RepID=A0A1H4IGQ0_9NOCA|nr:hypothetical protein SAMN04490239_0632 [Rhodococcus koreensis]